jgi:hypothetical protein
VRRRAADDETVPPSAPSTQAAPRRRSHSPHLRRSLQATHEDEADREVRAGMTHRLRSSKGVPVPRDPPPVALPVPCATELHHLMSQHISRTSVPLTPLPIVREIIGGGAFSRAPPQCAHCKAPKRGHPRTCPMKPKDY